MAGDYEDIDRWSNEQKSLLAQQGQQQNDLINQQTQLTVDELERNRDKIDKDVTKTTRGLYTDYQKQANQYGAEAERQAQMGLGNSGYAETSKVNLYNTYQKNVTEAMNNARQLKSDFDFQIAQARKQGSITQAQTALELLKQQMQLLTQEYEYRNNRRQYLEQFDYQKQRDAVSDSQWREQFDYQKQRDAVSDSQWEKQYELSKKAQATRSRRSSGSSSKYSVAIGDDNEVSSEEQNTQDGKINISQYSLDKKIESTLATTKPNSKARDNFLGGLVKSGKISNEEKAYLMGV